MIRFDIVVDTPKGAVFACRFVRDAEIAMVSTEPGTRMDVTKAHTLLGHGDEESTRQMAKELGWKLTRGKMKPCVHCACAKAKQKNTVKESKAEKAKVVGERAFLDGSSVKVPRRGGGTYMIQNKNWYVVVDQCSQKKWSHFFKTKKGMVEPICEWLHQMKAAGIAFQIIRMDPAGENLALEKRVQSVDWQALQPIKVELTSRETLQHNNLAELAFPYLGGKARSMMGAAFVPVEERGKVSIEAIKCATQLDGLRIVTINGVTATRDFHVYSVNPSWSRNLRTWGEAGVVKEGKDGKTGNRGIAMMFIGYPNNRESDSICMWNRSTNRVVVTRDVIWLKRMFFTRPDDDILWGDDADEVDEDGNLVIKPDEAADDEDDDATVKEEEAEEEQRQSKTVRWADVAEEATEELDVTDELVTPVTQGAIMTMCHKPSLLDLGEYPDLQQCGLQTNGRWAQLHSI
jgi:hypothetical protein